MSIKEWVNKLKILDPEDVKVLGARIDTIDIEVNGVLYTNVRLKRPFPYTHPECLILYDSNDEEVGILRDYRKLDKESKNLVERVLEVVYFMPRVKRILSINPRGGVYEWVVDTDKGLIKFKTWRSCARLLSNGKVIIKDVDGNVYCVENIFKLNSRSQALLSIFI